MSASTAYYRRLGPGRFQPTAHAGGAWQPGEQHMAPVSGLLAHAIEQFVEEQSRRATPLTLSRICYEILGMIPAVAFDISVAVIRPGRTIELVEAVLTVDGRPVVRARAWLLAPSDTAAVAGGEPDPMPAPDHLPVWDGAATWSGGYINSVEVRPWPDSEPGRTRAWLRTPVDLVDGEACSDLARYLGLVDTANGIAVRVPPQRWMFPNVDLTVHLHRTPQGRWVGLDTTVVFGGQGVGVTSSVLHDEHGSVGRAEQILTVRPLPPTPG